MNRALCSAAFCLLTLSISVVLAACGSASSGGSLSSDGSGLPITVAITPDGATVQPGGAVQITATVSNDAANRGVIWTISCNTSCGTISPTTTASGAATTYTAPSTQLVGVLIVNITATSVTNPASGTTVIVTVAGLNVSVSPDTATLQSGSTAQFIATVTNDPAAKGVAWSVSCPSAPCGAISPAATASGAPATYTAPSAQPLADLIVTITATSASNAAASASATVTVPGIHVSVAPVGSGLVPAGTTAQFTATVSNDSTNKGVTWALACSVALCGTVSPTTSLSGEAVTYTAPATPPTGDLIVTITATSVSFPSVSGAYGIRVPALKISVTPVSALLPLNITQEFTATVGNDAANKGVSWTLVQDGTPCTTGCGDVSPATTASGSPTTYTAPASVPANSTVTLTATSVADTSKSVTATITTTAGSVKLVPANLNFGKASGSSHPLNSTLTDTGNSALTINSITVAGTNPGDFSQTNTCGNSVSAGSSCTITAIFSTTVSGSRTAVILITDTSSDSPQHLNLSGTGPVKLNSAMLSALGEQSTAAVPRPTGGSPVGTRVMRFVDSTREDPYLSNGTKRELLVRFWYPAPSETACNAADYTSPEVWSHFSQLLGVTLPQVSTNSCLDARVSDGAHPVVVFSHGFTGTFTDYTFLFEDLASRGYVVASVNHTYEATAVEFPDGRLEKSVFGSYLTNYVRSDAQALAFAVSVRLDDLKFVLNEMEGLNAGLDSHFAAKLDLSRIAIAGHSLGGLTAILGVENEPRFKAGIVLDGVLPDHLASPMKTPILTVAAGRESWNEDDCRLWGALRGPRMAVNLKGADHLTPSDALWLAKGAVKSGEMGPDKTIAAIRDYVAAFLDVNLRGKPMGPLLAGPSSDFPDAGVTTQEQSVCRQP
jgi:dienelactone hydrolase